MEVFIGVIILILIVCGFAYFVAGGGGSSPSGPSTDQEFKILSWTRDEPRHAPRQNTKTPAGGPWKVHANPDAICLLTGVTARNCTCKQHRSTR
jgi:hypothetical protein